MSILASEYQEILIGKGLVNGVTAIELFTTRSGGTFTLLATGPKEGPDGAYLESCMIASGNHWAIFTPSLPGEAS